MIFANCGDAEKHEDDRFRRATQHLHRVLDGGMRFMRYIRLDVVLHRDTAECNSENGLII